MLKKYSVDLCQNSVFAICRDVKNEVFEKKCIVCFCLFDVVARETKIEKKQQNGIKAQKL